MRLPAPLQIVLFAVLFCAAYYAVCRRFRLDAPLSESNLQANLTRIAHYLYDEPADHSVVLAGSSISGRLLPAYFAAAGQPVQNLGLDGSRPSYVFEILRQSPRLPQILLVETTRLFDTPQANEAILRERIQSPRFRVSKSVPLLRAQYRPSSLIYSWMKLHRDASSRGIPLPPTAPLPSSGSPSEYSRVWNELADFQSRGVKVAIVEVPWHAGWGLPSHDAAAQLAQELDIPYLRPGQALAQRNVALEFSDGLHLNSRSAQIVAQEIIHDLRAREPAWHFAPL